MTIEFFTILILSYYVQDEHIQTKFVLKSMADCDKLIRVIVEPTRTIFPDANAHCIITEVMSTKIIKPKIRPEEKELNE